MRPYLMRQTYTLLFALLFAVFLSACGGQQEDTLVVYSGRSKVLVDPLVERFEQETGIQVEVRYGNDAELLAALQEEGANSPASIFWANTTGALGAASNANLLTTLPDSLLQMPAAFVPSSGRWVPITTRFRILAYNPKEIDPQALPASVMTLPSRTDLKGRVGWTPTYSSFQDFITAMRTLFGADTTRSWLNRMQELEPKAYPSNTPMLQALIFGEIDVALTNHYYVLRATQGEENADIVPYLDTYHFEQGDIGNLALVTGAGVLKTGRRQQQAHRFLSYLLSDKAQTFAAENVHEYPVTRSIDLPSYMLPVDEAIELSPAFDFERLRELDKTLTLMREAGLL